MTKHFLTITTYNIYSGRTVDIRIPCESALDLKRKAGGASQLWAESMRMQPVMTPMGMQMMPQCESPVIHVGGEYGTVALMVQDILRIVPEVVEDEPEPPPALTGIDYPDHGWIRYGITPLGMSILEDLKTRTKEEDDDDQNPDD